MGPGSQSYLRAAWYLICVSGLITALAVGDRLEALPALILSFPMMLSLMTGFACSFPGMFHTSIISVSFQALMSSRPWNCVIELTFTVKSFQDKPIFPYHINVLNLHLLGIMNGF